MLRCEALPAIQALPNSGHFATCHEAAPKGADKNSDKAADKTANKTEDKTTDPELDEADNAEAPPAIAPASQPYPDDSWIPRAMDALGHRATFHTDFTFDKAMLDMANNFVGDDETRQVIAKLRGISVHSYKFSAPGLYSPSDLDTVRVNNRLRRAISRT